MKSEMNRDKFEGVAKWARWIFRSRWGLRLDGLTWRTKPVHFPGHRSWHFMCGSHVFRCFAFWDHKPPWLGHLLLSRVHLTWCDAVIYGSNKTELVHTPPPSPPRENVMFNSSVSGSNKTSSRERGKWETLKFPGFHGVLHHVSKEQRR